MSKELARSSCKKDNKNPYDPQVGAAAQATAAAAQQAQDFTQDYFKQYVAPALDQSIKESAQNQTRLDEMYQADLAQQAKANDMADKQYALQSTAQGKLNDINDVQLASMKQQQERYTKYGIPAEDAYYGMVKNYSEPDYAEQQAALALGDVRSQQSNQSQQLLRQFSSMGIDPTSPAALAAASDAAVMGAATQASAQNQARNAAKQLGMQLTADAANFGRGGLSAATSIGQTAGQTAGQSAGTAANSASNYAGLGLNYNNAASGAIGQSSQIGNTTLAGLNSSAGVPLAGLNTAITGYGNNLSAYSGMSRQWAQNQAQSAGGIGSFLGTLGGAAISKFSDRRLKTDIVPLDAQLGGFQLYSFRYIWGGPQQLGVMADEVELVMPEAVSTVGGYKRVNYTMLETVR